MVKTRWLSSDLAEDALLSRQGLLTVFLLSPYCLSAVSSMSLSSLSLFVLLLGCRMVGLGYGSLLFFRFHLDFICVLFLFISLSLFVLFVIVISPIARLLLCRTLRSVDPQSISNLLGFSPIPILG
jgi:hypothetical protein